MAQEHHHDMQEIQQALQSAAEMSQQQNGQKRKQSDQAGPQQRTKRNRYISIACNECKRRKIKCNGETPCHRCGNLNLECIYAPNCCSSNFKDSNEFKQMNEQIIALQNEVNSLYHNINSLRSALGHELPPHEEVPYGYDSARSLSAPQVAMVDPALTRPVPKQSPHQAQFQGSNNSTFNLNLARSSLQTMGITGTEDGIDETTMQARDASPDPAPANRIHPAKDPIWGFNRDEALRLCQVYEDELGAMYPILNINRVSAHAKLLFVFIDGSTRSGLMIKEMPGQDALDDEKTSMLKLVLANALVVEKGSQNDTGRSLFENVAAHNDARLRGNVSLTTIRILVLTAMYHFHTDNEGLSWRVIGTVARLCLELGLHRTETYEALFKDEEERMDALKLFWSVYNLDRRWSFGKGMSFALHESDLDRNLPKPNEASPYLTVMIKYSDIGSQVWESIASSADGRVFDKSTRERADYLDYQISQWINSIPEGLRFIHPSSPDFSLYAQQHGGDGNAINSAGGRALHRLRVSLHLHANEMRILIYRPVLHSASSILANDSRDCAKKVVDVAKDTIRVLTHISTATDLCQTQPMYFNHFLLSAIAVLFLAVSRAPTQFSEQCRDDFHLALDLVRGFSARSQAGKRLWRTIHSLKGIGPKLGLYTRTDEAEEGAKAAQSQSTGRQQSQQAQHDAHSSAAMAMAGLAGHPIDETAFFEASQAGQVSSSSSSAFSPSVLANDLANLFEATGSCATIASQVQSMSSPVAAAAAVPSNGTSDAQGDAAAALRAMGQNVGPVMAWSNEDELNRALSDLF